MEILKIDMYLDGGTLEITTDLGIYCIDNRIKSKTKGVLYCGYPKDNNSNIYDNQELLKGKIINSLKTYYSTRILEIFNV